MTIIGGGTKLSITDNGFGSVTLSWPELLNPGADSYNVYVRQVTFTPKYEPPNAPPGGVFGPSAQDYAKTFGAWGTPASVTFSVSTKRLALMGGGFLQLTGGGFLLLQNSTAVGWNATVTGLQYATYIGRVLTPALTYEFKAVAVSGGVEVTPTKAAEVTPRPYSIMLTTPMKRLWPFPNTGLD